METKGFTLIELLAVIVILAIIAIIATPIVLNIIKDTKENSVKLSAEAYVDTVEKTYATKLMGNETLENKSYTIEELENLGVKVNGEKPSGENDYVILSNGVVVEYELTLSGYKISFKDGNTVVSSGDINLLDYTVKFVVDGNLYQSINVKKGQKINAPVDTPTKEGQYFSKWLLDGQGITFPYEPKKDIEINALFTTTRDELIYDKAGDVMFAGYFDSTDRTATKTNDGKAIAGYCKRSTGAYFACYVGETAESVAATNLKIQPTPIEYDGKIYYYSSTSTINRNIDTKKAWYIGSYEDGYVNGSNFVCNPNAIIRLLDYYYRKIES